MKVTLDEKQCLKSKLTLQEALIALAINMTDFKGTFKNMIARGIIDPTGSKLTDNWKNAIGKLMDTEEEIDSSDISSDNFYNHFTHHINSEK